MKSIFVSGPVCRIEGTEIDDENSGSHHWRNPDKKYRFYFLYISATEKMTNDRPTKKGQSQPNWF